MTAIRAPAPSRARFTRCAAVLLTTMTIGVISFAPASAQSVTGCLAKNGKLHNVQVGDQPLKPCGKNRLRISLGADNGDQV